MFFFTPLCLGRQCGCIISGAVLRISLLDIFSIRWQIVVNTPNYIQEHWAAIIVGVIGAFVY